MYIYMYVIIGRKGLTRHIHYVTQVTAAPSGTHTRAMGWEGSSPVRLHWRALQWDVDTGEGPRGCRRYPRRYRRHLRDALRHVLVLADRGAGGTASGSYEEIQTQPQVCLHCFFLQRTWKYVWKKSKLAFRVSYISIFVLVGRGASGAGWKTLTRTQVCLHVYLFMVACMKLLTEQVETSVPCRLQFFLFCS